MGLAVRKKCSSCGIMLDISYCKKCSNKRSAEWRAKNKEKKAKYEAEYRKRNIDRVNEREKEYRVKNKKKRYAKMKIYNEIKYGRMVKPKTCSSCKSGGDLEGHHHDYDKPLEVEWLCKKCHRGLHGSGQAYVNGDA